MDAEGATSVSESELSAAPVNYGSVLEAIKGGRAVFYVEDEADIGALQERGFAAFSCAGGRKDWRPDFGLYVTGCQRAIVIAVSGNGSLSHGKTVRQSFEGHARQSVLIELPCPASEWFSRGKGAKDLKELVREAVRAQIDTNPIEAETAVHMANDESVGPGWVVPGYIAAGLTILGGDPKVGKSLWSLATCLAITRGRRWMGAVECNRQKVLYLSLEDPRWTLKERIINMSDGDIPANLLLKQEFPRMGQKGWDTLALQLQVDPAIKLVIIDTYSKIHPGEQGGTAYSNDKRIGDELQGIAKRAGVALVILHHLVKHKSEKDPWSNFTGSMGITGSADNMLMIEKTESNKGLFRMRGRSIPDETHAILQNPLSGEWFFANSADAVRMSREELDTMDYVRTVKIASPAKMALDLRLDRQVCKMRLWKLGKRGLLVSEGGEYKCGHIKHLEAVVNAVSPEPIPVHHQPFTVSDLSFTEAKECLKCGGACDAAVLYCAVCCEAKALAAEKVRSINELFV